MTIHRHHPIDDADGRADPIVISPLDLLWGTVRSLETTVFKGGNGEKPILSRVEALEGDMEGVKKVVARMEKVEWGILLAIVSTLIAVLVKR